MFKWNFNFIIKEATPYNNIYFTEVFVTQGKIRELWLKKNNLLEYLKDYQMITKEASNSFIIRCEPFHDYEALFEVEEINKASFIFKITINDRKTGKIHSEGHQTICFAKNGKLVAIPEGFKKKLEENYDKSKIEKIVEKNLARIEKIGGYAQIQEIQEIAKEEKLNNYEEEIFCDILSEKELIK